MKIYTIMSNFWSSLVLFAEFHDYVSFIKKTLNIWGFLDKTFNNFFIDAFFYLNNYCLFISCLLLTLIIVIIILASRPFNEGLKTVLRLGACAITGATLANAANGKDDDDERRRREAEERKREEERRRAEERRIEEERKIKEEEQKQKLKQENDKKGKQKSWW